MTICKKNKDPPLPNNKSRTILLIITQKIEIQEQHFLTSPGRKNIRSYVRPQIRYVWDILTRGGGATHPENVRPNRTTLPNP